MPPAHPGEGHIKVQTAHAGGQHQELETVEQPTGGARQHVHHIPRGRDHIGRQGQTAAQQQRPQGDGRPVQQDPLRNRPLALDPPDLAQGALNRHHQEHRRKQHHGQASRAQTAGLARELRQVTEPLPGNAFGHQPLDQPALNRVLELAKHRKRRKNRQCHRKQGHQRQHGGEGERTGAHAQTRFAKPLGQDSTHLAPRKNRQLLPPKADLFTQRGLCQRVGHARYDATAMNTNPETSRPPAEESAPAGLDTTRWLAVGSLLGLIVLGLAWEIWLAPLREGGSWWAIKVLPLCIPVAGLLKNRMYTYRWVSMLVWLYFTEGVVRAWGDAWPSSGLAMLQTGLCTSLFVACALHVRIRFKAAKATGNFVPVPRD